MKKAFFGGSFDPPHYGHLGVARAALASGRCDHVVWFPSSTPPHKQNAKRASFIHRMNMVSILISDIPEMSVSDFEEKISLCPSYTIDVLSELKKSSGENYSLLIGADSLLSLHTWHDAEKLVNSVDLITYPRKGAIPTPEKLMQFWPTETVEKLMNSIIPGTFFEISSTEMKNSMEKYDFRHHIIQVEGFPPEIAEYIKKNRLYTAEKDNGKDNYDG